MFRSYNLKCITRCFTFPLKQSRVWKSPNNKLFRNNAKLLVISTMKLPLCDYSYLTRRSSHGHCRPYFLPQQTQMVQGSWSWWDAAVSAACETSVIVTCSDRQTLSPLSSEDAHKTNNIQWVSQPTEGINRLHDCAIPVTESSLRHMVPSPCGSPYSSSCKHWV